MYENKQDETIHQDRSQEINFVADGHRYIVNGVELPSVSKIMESLSKEKYDNIDAEVLARASKRGTAVHKAVELYETLGIESNDELVKDHLIEYRIAKRLHGIDVQKVELMMTNGLYCGTVDNISIVGGKLCIVDLKATSVINTDLLEVQLAGYQQLAFDNGYIIEKTYVLHLKKDGFKFKEIRPNKMLWQSLLEKYYDSLGS